MRRTKLKLQLLGIKLKHWMNLRYIRLEWLYLLTKFGSISFYHMVIRGHKMTINQDNGIIWCECGYRTRLTDEG